MKYKNYRNSKTNDNRIYTSEELKNMSMGEIFRRKEEILAQNRVIGVPSESELRSSSNVVYVHEYTREDGTHVRAHWRSKRGDGTAEIKEDSGIATGRNAKVSYGNRNVSDKVLEGRVEYKRLPDIKDILKQIKDKIDLPDVNPDVVKTILDVVSEVLKAIESQNKKVDLSVKQAEISSPNVSNIRLKSHVKLTPPKSVLVNINNKQNKNYKDARQCMNIALIEPENIENNSDFKVLSENELRIMSSRMRFDIPEDVKTVQYSPDSSLANAIQESPKFQDAVKTWVATPPEQRQDKILLELDDNENLARSILHATIFQPRIENGYFKGYLYDLYDFKLQWFKDPYKTIVNDLAVLLQAAKKLKNYNIIIPLEFEL